MRLSDKAYQILKWIMILASPFCTFVTGLIVAIQTADPVAITTAVIGGLGTFVGCIIKASDTQYYKEVNSDDESE